MLANDVVIQRLGQRRQRMVRRHGINKTHGAERFVAQIRAAAGINCGA